MFLIYLKISYQSLKYIIITTQITINFLPIFEIRHHYVTDYNKWYSNFIHTIPKLEYNLNNQFHSPTDINKVYLTVKMPDPKLLLALKWLLPTKKPCLGSTLCRWKLLSSVRQKFGFWSHLFLLVTWLINQSNVTSFVLVSCDFLEQLDSRNHKHLSHPIVLNCSCYVSFLTICYTAPLIVHNN